MLPISGLEDMGEPTAQACAAKETTKPFEEFIAAVYELGDENWKRANGHKTVSKMPRAGEGVSPRLKKSNESFDIQLSAILENGAKAHTTGSVHVKDTHCGSTARSETTINRFCSRKCSCQD